MHLIGSRTEDEFRKQLAASRSSLIYGDGEARLRTVLLARGADLSRCIVVYWIPEQGEDIYEVLHGADVLRIEIPHDGSEEVTVQSEALTDYLRRCHGRPQRIKMAVALDMLQKGLSDAASYEGSSGKS